MINIDRLLRKLIIIFCVIFTFAVKQHLKCVNEIANENVEHQSVITKSASTPASLQAIVRFQNGSNMSLQHRVSGKFKKFLIFGSHRNHILLDLLLLGGESSQKFKSIHHTWTIKISFITNSIECISVAYYCR